MCKCTYECDFAKIYQVTVVIKKTTYMEICSIFILFFLKSYKKRIIGIMQRNGNKLPLIPVIISVGK